MRLWLLFSLALLSAGLQAEIIIENARVYATAPGQNNAAAFMVIKNSAETPAVLTALNSDVAEKTELHEQIDNNGMMRMQPVKQFEVAGKSQQVLAHGGKHIMLINLKNPLKAGDSVNLQLCFGELCVKQAITVVSLQETKHHHKH